MMYGAVLPVYRSDSKKKGKEEDNVIDMDDPKNQHYLEKFM